MTLRALTPIALALLVGCYACLLFAKPAATLPTGFTDSVVVERQNLLPTALAFTPDGRMLVASRTGQLRVYDEGRHTAPVLRIGSQICTKGERGLLGLAVDPRFAENGYIHLYYTTFADGGQVRRISYAATP